MFTLRSAPCVLALSMVCLAPACAKPVHTSGHKHHVRSQVMRMHKPMQPDRRVADLGMFGRNEPLIILPDRSGVGTVFKARQGQFYGNQNYYSDLRNWGY